MDIKLNTDATANPVPVFPKKSETASKKNEAASQVKGAVTSGAKKGEEVTVGLAGKKEVNYKDAAAEMQEVLRKAFIDTIPQRELRISFEKDLNRVVFRVHDKSSGELIRQIPMPEQLAISRNLREWMDNLADDQSGIAVDQEV